MKEQIFKISDDIPQIEANHPGKYLLEEINERNLLKKEIAKQLDVLPHHLIEIFKDKRNPSANMTLRLEKALDISAEYWLALQVFEVYRKLELNMLN